jgi:histidinol-phosphatase (PHP family)
MALKPKEKAHMTDTHIHIEKGPYTLEWLNEFIKQAVKKGIDEIYFLEHSNRFFEFGPMYRGICEYSKYQNEWYNRKCCLSIQKYIDFVKEMKKIVFPVKVKFGLEVCYFQKYENLIYDIVNSFNFDFVTGSVHWLDGFGFDHKPEFWDGIDVNKAYKRFFEITGCLIESRLFTGLAHPDSIKCFGHKPDYSLLATYDNIAGLLYKNGMYAEQNGGVYLRIPGGELGMNELMIKAFKQHNVDIRTASDSHRPEDAGANIKELQSLLN